MPRPSVRAAAAGALLAALLAAPAHADRPVPGMLAFGQAVAIAGADVLVGEPDNTLRPGMVYVYRRQGAEWARAAELTAPGGRAGDGFGGVLAADGTTLAVAADSAIHLFRRAGTAWTHAAALPAPGAGVRGGAVTTLALSGDVLLAGMSGANGNRGAVATYARGADGRWTRGPDLPPSGLSGEVYFGMGLAVEGGAAVVGAPGGPSGGAVLLYRRTPQGTWTRDGGLAPGKLNPGEAFGAAVALRGGLLLAGAPGVQGATGAVHVFRRGASGWAPGPRLMSPAPRAQSLFGLTVALGPDAVWVGAPGTDDFRGAVVVFPVANGAVQGGAGRLVEPEGARAPEENFGGALAAGEGVAAVGVVGAEYSAGRVAILDRQGGAWRIAASLASPPEGLAAVRGARVPCENGRAGAFECQGVDLLSFLPNAEMGGGRGIRSNDIWGWTDGTTGKEYAIVGMTDGTAFVDVTDPVNPVYVGRLPRTEGSPGTAWRGMRTYRDHVYVVSDGAGEHGVQVMDLGKLRAFSGTPLALRPDTVYRRVNSAHNIFVNEETGFAYSVGGSSGGETCGGGLHMIDVRTPRDPKFVGCFADPRTGLSGTGYSHDVQCVVYRGPDTRYTGREICLGSNETAISVADVTDKAAPRALSRATYPNAAYAHQGWLSEDQRWFYMNDELDELQGSVRMTRTLIWDLEDLEDPQLAGQFLGTTEATDHNLYIVGDRIFQSHYHAGLRILRIRAPTDLAEVAWFDTKPYGDNGVGFGGSWSNYPFFRSGNVIVSSGSEGLFVVRPR